MFGAFRSSFTALGGLVQKIPWKLNATRKANVRKRIEEVQSVVDALKKSEVQFKALEKAPVYTTPTEKYFVKVRITPSNHKGLKGVHRIPHFTKLPRDFETFHEKR